jgi:hypothetical protein
MNESHEKDYTNIWQSYVENQIEAESLKKTLLSSPKAEIVALLQKALNSPRERLHALRLLKIMRDEDREALMPDLLALATWQNQVTELAKELVFSVPREWLRGNFLQCAQPLLNGLDHQEMWGLLEICSQLDPQMGLDLARRFATHANPDIRDASESFISKLESKN